MEELRQVKKKEITVPAQESIMKAGWKPDQFRSILQKAIGKLRGFIQFMKEISWRSTLIRREFPIHRMSGWISLVHFPSIRCFRRSSNFGD